MQKGLLHTVLLVNPHTNIFFIFFTPPPLFEILYAHVFTTSNTKVLQYPQWPWRNYWNISKQQQQHVLYSLNSVYWKNKTLWQTSLTHSLDFVDAFHYRPILFTISAIDSIQCDAIRLEQFENYHFSRGYNFWNNDLILILKTSTCPYSCLAKVIIYSKFVFMWFYKLEDLCLMFLKNLFNSYFFHSCIASVFPV